MKEETAWCIFGICFCIVVAILIIGLIYASHTGNINTNAAHIKELQSCVKIKDPTGALACINQVLSGY